MCGIDSTHSGLMNLIFDFPGSFVPRPVPARAPSPTFYWPRDQHGIKGEMPKFGEKLTDTDVQG
jgi:hypothetical protein